MSSRRPVVLITGGSKGIGFAVTKILLHDFNAIVVTVSRTRTPELDELVTNHGESILVVECSVSDEVAFSKAISLAEQTYHHIDALILNAGTLLPMDRIGSNETGLDAWKMHFDVNFFSLITALKGSLPALRRSELGGRVIFISSHHVDQSLIGCGPYGASKAAMNSLCRTLAAEEPDIVSVALEPGIVATNIYTTFLDAWSVHMTEDDLEKFKQSLGDFTFVPVEDCGHVIAALALHAPKTLNGRFVDWNSEECKGFRRN